jgi:alpha-ribazole phosphatase
MPVILMRHPAVDFIKQRCIGQFDIDLSPRGRISLRSLAIEACRLEPDRLISSDLKRCRLLAEEVAFRLNIRPEFDPIWREIHFGSWENRRWEEIRAEDPETFEEWAADFVRVAPPGGESFGELHQRFMSGLSRLGQSESDILVVTHAGVIRAANATFSKIPLSRAFEFQVPYGAIFRCPDSWEDAAVGVSCANSV